MVMYLMRHVHMLISWQMSMVILLYIHLMIWHVATGQGSIAMEIIKELPTVDYILVPIGGGGLCTGVSTLAKLLNPKIKVIGVEPAGANCMQESLRQGHVCNPSPGKHHCRRYCSKDILVRNCFPYIQQNVDDIITISMTAI
ncbi:MAG: pyridoxal-phosphate dependent enzyme [Lachnospira sp.]